MAEPIFRLITQIHTILIACDQSLQVLAFNTPRSSLSLASLMSLTCSHETAIIDLC